MTDTAAALVRRLVDGLLDEDGGVIDELLDPGQIAAYQARRGRLRAGILRWMADTFGLFQQLGVLPA